MKLFPAYLILWPCLLVLQASQSDVSSLLTETEANNPDVCQADNIIDDLQCHSGQDDNVEENVLNDNFLCLLYPTNILNCSWSFSTLQKDTPLSVYISTCDNERAVHSLKYLSVERVGSRSLILQEHKTLYVILQFNITLLNEWTVCTYTYTVATLEVLSPPQNISAFIKDGDLLVTWGLPYSRIDSNPSCFTYQLDFGDQERPRNLTDQLSDKLLNADASYTYRVKIRTRNLDICQHNSQWSDWSHTVTVEQSITKYKLNTPVIISITLGIPMILLAVLLVVRHQRVTKVLFPPIPHPPPKYIHLLEKNETFNLFRPALSAEPVEEITEVEDTEQDPGNARWMRYEKDGRT